MPRALHRYDDMPNTPNTLRVFSADGVDEFKGVVKFAAPVVFSAVSVDDFTVLLKSAAQVVELMIGSDGSLADSFVVPSLSSSLQRRSVKLASSTSTLSTNVSTVPPDQQ